MILKSVCDVVSHFFDYKGLRPSTKCLACCLAAISLAGSAWYAVSFLLSRAGLDFFGDAETPREGSPGASPVTEVFNKAVPVQDQEKQKIVIDQKFPPAEIIRSPESQQLRSYTKDTKNVEWKDYEIGDKIIKTKCPSNQNLQIEVRCQDIFKSGADVIVNAANTGLVGGTGIDGDVHTKGGERYQQAHKKDLKKLYPEGYVTGHAAMLPSGDIHNTFNIPHVIVVAGPRLESGAKSASDKQKNDLYTCYYNSLLLAHQNGKKHIAFPSISTGVYSFPRGEAAVISLKAISDFVCDYPDTKLQMISIHFLPTGSLDSYRNHFQGNTSYTNPSK